MFVKIETRLRQVASESLGNSDNQLIELSFSNRVQAGTHRVNELSGNW
jgi:hypothetical protein